MAFRKRLFGDKGISLKYNFVSDNMVYLVLLLAMLGDFGIDNATERDEAIKSADD